MIHASQPRVQRRCSAHQAAVACVVLLACGASVRAQAPTTFQYIYDDKNQLIKVIDPTGVMIQHVYDVAGNMQQVIRSAVTPGVLTIFNITPLSVAAGSTITIQGQGFSTTANTVTLNGANFNVVSATATTLVVQIPTNAMGGTISVTVGGVTVTSSSIMILPVPGILTLSPESNARRNSLHADLVGHFRHESLLNATFAFSPLLPITSAAINLSGTSATLMVSPAASALGYYTLVATNGVGPSSAIPIVGFLPTVTAFNTIAIPGSNPNADPDTDGLTNAQEIADSTDPLNSDTDGDHYPDGIEVLYGPDPLNPLSIPVIPPSAPNVTGRVFSIENQISAATFSPQTYAVSGLTFSMLNSTSPATFLPQTYTINGLPFSMLNSVSPATFSTQTYTINGLPFSMLELGLASDVFRADICSQRSALLYSEFELASGIFDTDVRFLQPAFFYPQRTNAISAQQGGQPRHRCAQLPFRYQSIRRL